MCEHREKDSSEIFCLDPEFSTTRKVTRQEPVIKNHPEDQFETKLFLPEGEGRQGEGGLRTQGYFKKSLTDKPLISVITVVFKGEKYLEETIQSVINQTYDNVEYIIIDGGSNDGTLDIIRKYEHAIDYWISENDEGIYDAMNKGIALSTGLLIGIINSDDWYEREALKYVASKYNQNPNIGLLHGKINVYDKYNKFVNTRKGHDYPIFNRLTTPFKHPTCFVALTTYKKIGRFDLKYKYVADYELMLRIIKNKVNRLFVNKIISSYRKVGITTGGKNTDSENELKELLYKYTGSKITAYCLFCYRRFRKLL